MLCNSVAEFASLQTTRRHGLRRLRETRRSADLLPRVLAILDKRIVDDDDVRDGGDSPRDPAVVNHLYVRRIGSDNFLYLERKPSRPVTVHRLLTHRARVRSRRVSFVRIEADLVPHMAA